jgi:hypothetical protein
MPYLSVEYQNPELDSGWLNRYTAFQRCAAYLQRLNMFSNPERGLRLVNLGFILAFQLPKLLIVLKLDFSSGFGHGIFSLTRKF